MKKLGITLAVLMGLLIVLTVATSGDKPATNSLGARTSEAGKQIGQNVQDAIPTTPQTATSEAPEPEGYGDGVYEVGVDIPAGKYKTPGGSDSGFELCYWDRTKKNDGSLGDIKQQEVGPGKYTVTLKDGYFKTSDCGTWTKVG